MIEDTLQCFVSIGEKRIYLLEVSITFTESRT